MDSLTNPKIDVSSCKIRKSKRDRVGVPRLLVFDLSRKRRSPRKWQWDGVGVERSHDSRLVAFDPRRKRRSPRLRKQSGLDVSADGYYWDNHCTGPPLKDVLSITIYRKTGYNGSDPDVVKIYGVIGIEVHREMVEYVFMRGKDNPQVFKSPGNELTLALRGPVNSLLLHQDEHFRFVGLLICNGETIFSATHCAQNFRNKYLDGLSDIFAKDDNNVYGEDGVRIGYAACCPPLYYMRPGVFSLKIDNSTPDINAPICLNSIDYVEVVMVAMAAGLVGCIKITALGKLSLSGEIRACQFGQSEGVVLFQKNKDDPVWVDSDALVPLSRSMAAVSVYSCLEIKFEKVRYNKDGDDGEISDTIQVLVGETYSKDMLDVFKVDVEWSDAVDWSDAGH